MLRKASVNGFCGVSQNQKLCVLMIFRELIGNFQLLSVSYNPEVCVKTHSVYMYMRTCVPTTVHVHAVVGMKSA